MSYLPSHIASILQGESILVADHPVEQILLDSRRVYAPGSSLFFALKGPRRDGHSFIPELYKKGVRNFVVSEMPPGEYPQANFIIVTDTLVALQALAAWHRQQFTIPVIGITGSNGKTVVKEWLYQLLENAYTIVRSPRSYNSQIGVPLSVWQMHQQHNLALFEAGISEKGEMEKLEAIIQPTIGVLTNIGEAHSEGFDSFTEKLLEKIKLFKKCRQLVYCKDNAAQLDPERGDQKFFDPNTKFYHWSRYEKAWLQVEAVQKNPDHTLIQAKHEGREISIRIPFNDDASIENAITCWCVLLAMDIPQETIAARMPALLPVNMRLVFNKGLNHCNVINDSYSADLSSLEIALNFLDQQSAGASKTVILSDFLQSALPDEELYPQILASLTKRRVSRLIGIGNRISSSLQEQLPNELMLELYPSTQAFLRQFRSSQFNEETILVKGARSFAFEQIARLLEQKVHETVLEINLNAIAHNLKEYQKLLQPDTRVMAMVKAFAYGSGGAEIAGILQYQQVDYLAVAYADEGVELRKAGITTPIMVMNPEAIAFATMVEYDLEPELFSFELLHAFDLFLKRDGLLEYPVHIEIETGMNRLGFAITEMEMLAEALNKTSALHVQSVFSHLAASEDPQQDAFTMEQYKRFEEAASILGKKLGYSFIRHIANSAAVVRNPLLHLDMVRLGIGLYGVDSAATGKLNLQTVATLKSTIAQVKKIKAGESVSYNRKSVVNRDSIIATVRLGYADGYPRRLGNGKGKISVQGPDEKAMQAPVIGTVCMDMTMIDITDIPGVREGDDVIIFGESLPVQQVAQWADTIPYEIMTNISQRVKRVYFEE